MKTKQTQKLLKLLNANPCCDCPPISDDEGNIIECREDGIYASADGSGSESMLFGVAGEDDAATVGVPRLFDAGEEVFTITGYGNGLNLVQTDAINWLNGLSINDTTSQLLASSLLNSTEAKLILAPNGQAVLISEDIANAISSSITVNFASGIDLLSGSFISDYSNIAMYPSGMFIDVFDNASGDEIYMEWVGGSQLAWDFIGDAVWNISGLEPDDTANSILALDSLGNVVVVDKTTIGTPAGTIVIDYDTVNVANDGTPNTGFSLPVEAGANYAIEAYLRPIHSSGVGYNLTFLLPGSATFFDHLIEFSAPANGGEIDTTLIKREVVIGETLFNLPNASFHSPAGSPVLKVIGFIDTNDTAGNITLQVALDAAGPQTGSVVGWIKLTKIS